MALDLRGFNTGEQNFGGLYKLSDNLEKNKYRKEHEQQIDSANKNAMSKFMADYLDPKEHLSGSPYDPEITKGYMDLLNESSQLIRDNKGITTDMLLTAMAPKVNKLSQYASAAKSINQQLKEKASQIPENSGYDKLSLLEQARKTAFYNEDGTKKDIGTIDPEADYFSQVVKTHPELVTNNKGIDEWLSKNKMVEQSHDVLNINSKGGRERKKVKSTAYTWATPSIDESGVNDRTFEPKYDHAYDSESPILHEGKKIKILDNDVYKSILANSPGTADWLRGQINIALKSGEYKDNNGKQMDMRSPNIDLLGKAILFDELKNRGLGGMQDIIENKQNPVKIYMTKAASQPSEKKASQMASESDLHSSLNDKESDGIGNIDVTDLLSGINIIGQFKKPIIFDNVLFNPNKKEFTFKTADGEEKMPYHKVASLAATANSGVDRDWLKGFNTYNRNSTQKPKEDKKNFLDVMGGWIKKGAEAIKPKEKTPVYKGLDKDGNPIFE